MINGDTVKLTEQKTHCDKLIFGKLIITDGEIVYEYSNDND